jgi:predicted homoserine dehydrogenase-like protein
MIIVDSHLQARAKEGKPVRVGLLGAGEMGKGITYQIMKFTSGMQVAAIANRTLSKAIEAFENVGIEPQVCDNLEKMQKCVSSGGFAVTENAELLCQAEGIDVIVEATGTIHYAADLVLKAIQNKKNVLLYNPELEATLGPILKTYADKAGVMIGGCDGDQPGAIVNLYRYVKTIGLTPLICGNIKGLQDFYRTPTTQASFAAKWGMKPEMVTSFADGSKISFEQTCAANATGMGVAKRGMLGYHHNGHIDDMVSMYDVEELKKIGGMIDYVVGPKPGPGVYVFATTDDPKLKKYLNYMKMGEGPLYSFYTPYHLICMEVPISIARMALLKDIVTAPIAGPVVEVITHAKADLRKGKVLDGIGGYDAYGQCENASVVHKENLLPIGLSEGAIIKRDLPKDYVITFDDIEFSEDTLVFRLYREQAKLFFPDLEKTKALA